MDEDSDLLERRRSSVVVDENGDAGRRRCGLYRRTSNMSEYANTMSFRPDRTLTSRSVSLMSEVEMAQDEVRLLWKAFK